MDKDIDRKFHPLFSKVILIGIKPRNQKSKFFYGDDESKILLDLWDYLRKSNLDLIVSFNGYRFDIPFLYVRSLLNEVKPSLPINTNKYNMDRSNHFDCMLALSHYDVFPWVSLEIACRMFKIEIPQCEVKGSQIRECYKNGKWEGIIKKCEADLTMLEKLYSKISDGLM
ncbi:MAG: ribonuclease H-like domain-containing protein [Methanocellales archaeon]